MKKEGKSSELELELITTEYQESQNVIAQRNYLSVSLNIKGSLESGYYYKNLIEKTMKEICKEENDDKANSENISENDKKSSNTVNGEKAANKDEEVSTSIISQNLYMVIQVLRTEQLSKNMALPRA